MRINDRVYAYPWRGRGNNCNSYLYKGKKTVLFDPGHIYNEFRESCLEALARQMAGDGFSLEDIELILCTHAHPDHVEAAGIVRERSGAMVALHRQDEFILEAIERRYASAAGKEIPALRPDFYLREGDLDLGLEQPEQIRVIHTPGHSPGSSCFYLPQQKALITGDTVFVNSIGRFDLPGGDEAVLGESVAKLAGLGEVELLLPGHMGHLAGAEEVRQNFARIRRFFFGEK
jgi:glyoxylase-like metal-dependent hydrolase (beta-lactamase superfamily II)